jgi:hypothetical protein
VENCKVGEQGKGQDPSVDLKEREAKDRHCADGKSQAPIIGGLTMVKNISRLPHRPKQIPIDIVQIRLRDHVERVLASNNAVLIRMIEQFFSEMIDRFVDDDQIEHQKAAVVPIRKKEKDVFR